MSLIRVELPEQEAESAVRPDTEAPSGNSPNWRLNDGARAKAERQNLKQLVDRVDGLLKAVMGDVLTVDSREAIEQTVCDRLATVDSYQFAWVSELDCRRDVSSMALSPTDRVRHRSHLTPTTRSRSGSYRGDAGRDRWYRRATQPAC